MLKRTLLLPFISLLPLACSPGGSGPGPASQALRTGRVHDLSQTRMGSSFGDKWNNAVGMSAAEEIASAGLTATVASKGGWSLNLGPVNGGAALYGNTTTIATPDCTDRLYIPINASSGANLYAYDNLYDGCALATATSCTASPGGHCPRQVWTATLNGAFSGNSLALNLDGSRLYAVTSTGQFYDIDTSTGSNAATPVDATTLYPGATFINTGAWVDYGAGPFANNGVYVAGSCTSGGTCTNGAFVMKLSAAGAVQYHTPIIPQSGTLAINSTPIFYNTFLYVGGTDQKVYRFNDTGMVLSQNCGAGVCSKEWFNPTTGGKVLGALTIDTTANTVFGTAGGRVFGANITTPGNNNTGNIGLSTSNESSVYCDVTNRTLYVGHAQKLQSLVYSSMGGITSLNTAQALMDSNGANDPASSPVVVTIGSSTYVYIGVDGGFLDRYTVNTTTGASLGTLKQSTSTPANITTATRYGTASAAPVAGPIVIDAVGGNLYFGTGSPDNSFHQIAQDNGSGFLF